MVYTILLLAISLSMDALGLGISYGMQNIKILIIPKLLICFSSVIYAMMGLGIGNWLVNILGSGIADKLGICILILIGLWMIVKCKNGNNEKQKLIEATYKQKKAIEIAIKSIGITIKVIKNPNKGDIDNSGVIDIKEAVLLGVALNIDAMVVCMGSIMAGVFSMVIPLIIGIVQMLFIDFGLYIGYMMFNKKVLNEKIISVVPGIILIVLGIIRMF